MKGVDSWVILSMIEVISIRFVTVVGGGCVVEQ